ncbi:MAG: hypothetical protein K9N23_10950 [Akkermansiaceae bacterium]|nr:hypothetical protein [Akkermansiaceae bacterium]MCF7732199.1 hypothetical protein [Akkermansiaceae bacterium]
MKIRALILALAALAPLSSTLPAATLGEMVSSSGLEWMVGKWASEDGNVSFSHTWKLDKHALAVTFKMGERESEGMIMVKPGTDEVIYGAVDNTGGMAVGKWTKLNGNPTLISTHTGPDGRVRKMAVEYIHTDDETLTVKIHKVDEDDQPDPTAGHEATFKRQQ